MKLQLSLPVRTSALFAAEHKADMQERLFVAFPLIKGTGNGIFTEPQQIPAS